jgi:phosphate transport system permease protein
MKPAGRERWIETLLGASALFSGLAVLGILGSLVVFTLPLLRGGDLGEVLSWDWRPHEGSCGILPMVVGSLLLSLLALAVAFPVGLAVCCFAHGLAPRPLGKAVLAVVHFMTSIPTIVYAFVSAVALVPLVRGLFATGSGYSLLTATLVLSVLILPTIVLLIHAYWRGMGDTVATTCAALGLTRAQQLFRVLIPLSGRGLAAAATLGLGRAVGDTMIALLLSGNAPQVPESPLDSFRTLTAHIAMTLQTDTESTAFLSVFAAGLVLLFLTAGLNLAARLLHSFSRNAVTLAETTG